MKKILISIGAILLTVFLGIFFYHKITYEETYYDYTHFEEIPKLVEKKEKVIIFVVQDGCSYCKMVEPFINDYAKDNKGVVYAVVANQEEDYITQMDKYKIMGTPTLIFYENGKEVFRQGKGFTNDEFQEMIKKVDF